jgi:hypothetical protein
MHQQDSDARSGGSEAMVSGATSGVTYLGVMQNLVD